VCSSDLGEKCNGKKFSKLEQKYISRIEDTQLSVNILDSRTPDAVKYDVFTRINTGGVPLNAQEIRNVMATKETMSFLERMVKSGGFEKATHGAVKDIRMDAQELCLRFITFYRAYDTKSRIPRKDKPLAKMLDECILHLNTCNNLTLSNYFDTFETAMEKSSAAFGNRAFMKPKYKVINKPLFTSWAVTLAYSTCSQKELSAYSDILIEKLTTAINKDSEFFNAITASTATSKSIENQFVTAQRILEETINAYMS
jgi:hypothetical protein